MTILSLRQPASISIFLAAGLVVACSSAGVNEPGSAATALAGTSQFRGVNWARLGDNFDTGPLVPQGLSLSDDYQTVAAKTGDMLTAFQSIGANTIRLPLNPASVNTDTSVGPDWWDSYTAAIDTATAKGFNVVLSYWEEGAQGGKIVDMTTWNNMWNEVVARYLSNPRVYFDPMNEPHGYSSAEWIDIAAKWLSDRPSVPRDRIIVAGTGFDWDVKPLCADSRFDGTYLAFHHYAWDEPDITTYDGWVNNFQSFIGGCASRTILEEFGATMDNGSDYDDPNSASAEVSYLRAYTDTVRSLHMGAIYWAGIGGRYLASDGVGGYETLNVQRLYSSDINVPLWTPNTTGLDRLTYAWGLGSGSDTTPLQNGAGGNCLDVPRTTHDNVQVIAYPCNGGDNQKWTRTAGGQITVYGGEKCLDAYGQGKSNGTPVGTYPCNGGDNQKWRFYTDGTIRGVQSGRCLDVNAATSELELWDCTGGANQQWKIR